MADLIVYDHTGARLELTPTGKSGGEGAVHLVKGSQTECAKVYHPAKRTSELHSKVLAMVNNPPRDPTLKSLGHRSIAWPLAALYADKAKRGFLGFTMPFVNTSIFKQCDSYCSQHDRLKRFGGNFTWQHLFFTARNLASAVAAIHQKGHRVGDLREANILVGPTTLVTLVDCDSFQILDKASGKVYFTRVGTAEYLPPETAGVNFGKTDYDREQSDYFALAVLIFQLLMNGFHPYSARGKGVDDAPTTADKILKGKFAYPGKLRDVSAPPAAFPFDVLPARARSLMERCFIDGHRSPKKRPSAKEWFAALSIESKRLRQCGGNRNHWFSADLKACPWCGISTTRQIDPFPDVGQVPLPRARTLKSSPVAQQTVQPTVPAVSAGSRVKWVLAIALPAACLLMLWAGGRRNEPASSQQAAVPAASMPAPARTGPPPVVPAAVGSFISVDSVPGGAILKIDGNDVGTTPARVQVQAGSHTVMVEKAGYAAESRTVLATRDDTTLNVTLVPATGERVSGKVLSSSSGTVTVDLGRANAVTVGTMLEIQLHGKPVLDPRDPSNVLGYRQLEASVAQVEAHTCQATLTEPDGGMPAPGDVVNVKEVPVSDLTRGTVTENPGSGARPVPIKPTPPPARGFGR